MFSLKSGRHNFLPSQKTLKRGTPLLESASRMNSMLKRIFASADGSVSKSRMKSANKEETPFFSPDSYFLSSSRTSAVVSDSPLNSLSSFILPLTFGKEFEDQLQNVKCYYISSISVKYFFRAN